MIIDTYGNNVNVTERAQAQQETLEQVERRMLADIESGKRKFWRGMSACYCANAAEYGGFLLAADEYAEDEERWAEVQELEAAQYTPRQEELK